MPSPAFPPSGVGGRQSFSRAGPQRPPRRSCKRNGWRGGGLPAVVGRAAHIASTRILGNARFCPPGLTSDARGTWNWWRDGTRATQRRAGLLDPTDATTLDIPLPLSVAAPRPRRAARQKGHNTVSWEKWQGRSSAMARILKARGQRAVKKVSWADVQQGIQEEETRSGSVNTALSPKAVGCYFAARLKRATLQ